MTRRDLLQAVTAITSGMACAAQAQTPGFTPASSTSAPPADAQVALINNMRAYAQSYEAGLPNFLCTQVTTHYLSGTKRENWHKGDTVTAQLSFSNGKEHSAIKLINNKAVSPSVRPWRWNLSTEGEFGAVLVRIFAEESAAKFEWQGWEDLAGQRTAGFLFSVAQENSTLKLSSFGVSAYVGYKGMVWAEPTTGHVLKIEDQAVAIPEELQVESIGTTLQYASVDISGKQYVLPTRAEVIEKTPHQLQRNVIEFREYRKFEAESTLTFGDAQPQR